MLKTLKTKATRKARWSRTLNNNFKRSYKKGARQESFKILLNKLEEVQNGDFIQSTGDSGGIM